MNTGPGWVRAAHLRCDVVGGTTEGAGPILPKDVLLTHAKVRDLDVTLLVQQHVVQLQVPAVPQHGQILLSCLNTGTLIFSLFYWLFSKQIWSKHKTNKSCSRKACLFLSADLYWNLNTVILYKLRGNVINIIIYYKSELCVLVSDFWSKFTEDRNPPTFDWMNIHANVFYIPFPQIKTGILL